MGNPDPFHQPQGQAAVRRFLDGKGLIYKHRAAANLQHADATEAAWWYSVMANGRQRRAVRAFRILAEAVK